jgi:hypothetical protein
LAGRLAIAEGGAELAVLENFGHGVLAEAQGEMVFSPVPVDVPRVLGLSADGKAITLENCRAISAPMSFPGISRATYRASAAIVGAWFADGEEISFDEIAIRTASLDAWVAVTGFSQATQFTMDESGSVATGIASAEVQLSPPARIDIALEDRGDAWIDFRYTVGGVHQLTTEVTLRQEAWFHYRPRAPFALPEVFQLAGKVRNFISLAIGKSETVASVFGYRDDLCHGSARARIPIELHWQIPHNPPPPARPVHPTEMLFTLGEAEPDIGAVLTKWLAQHDTFEPVLNLYFGVLHHADLYLDVKFLAYAQALETYDFRRRDPHELDSAAHRDRMASVVASAPEDWREWLRMRLASSNYWTLDQRVRAVLSECPDVSARIVGTGAERDKFIRMFKNSRNYYTHYAPRLERHAATGAALYLLFVQLRAIIEMSLLRELGFATESIDRTLERCGRYREIAHFRDVAATEQDPG